MKDQTRSSAVLPSSSAGGGSLPRAAQTMASLLHRNIWPTRVFSQKNSLAAVRVSFAGEEYFHV